MAAPVQWVISLLFVAHRTPGVGTTSGATVMQSWRSYLQEAAGADEEGRAAWPEISVGRGPAEWVWRHFFFILVSLI